MSENNTKSGVETSEFKVAKSGSFWGIVSIVIGTLITVASIVAEIAGSDTKLGIVVGAVIGVVGGIQKLLTDRGYIESRTKVKIASTPEKE